jgi:hypothetical protein
MRITAAVAMNQTTSNHGARSDVRSARYDGLRLFALSFAALFLELMVIRWAPAVVLFVAYYSNLMLISSFLGLGLGVMTARRRWNLIAWFPTLLLLNVGTLYLCHKIVRMPTPGAEFRFGQSDGFFLNYLVLVGIFVLNTAVFVPLGQQIGRLFRQQKPLRAYALDLGGSLCGTIIFGLFSLYHFSPAIGMAAIAVIYIAIERSHFLVNSLLLVAAVMVIPLSVEPGAIWSPYYYVVIHPAGNESQEVFEPPPHLRTMLDPPLYTVSVNTVFYQWDGTLDLGRYTRPEPVRYVRDVFLPEYLLPYKLHPGAKKVCVVGAGGGLDVQAALMSGRDRPRAHRAVPPIQLLRRLRRPESPNPCQRRSSVLSIRTGRLRYGRLRAARFASPVQLFQQYPTRWLHLHRPEHS